MSLKEDPLLSIITINLNDLGGLKKTFGSVNSQTWQEFEYIIIDGGSTDGSKEFLESQKDQVDYWVSEPDKGIFNAMNKGITQSSGKYLLFLNSGDRLKDDQILDKVKDRIKNQDLIYFDLEMFDDNNKFIKTFPEKLSFSFFINHSLPHPSTFIKREVLLEAGLYDESLKISSDWKFFIDAVCKMNCSYLYVNECLTAFNLYGISSTEEMRGEMYQEREKFLKEKYSAFLQDCMDLENCEGTLRQLRSSRKIEWLVKLGLIKKF